MTAMSDSAMTNQAYSLDASGVIGNEKRRKPYAPSLSMIAASTAEPPVGASTCTSGSQVCTGHIGTFTENAAKNAKNSSVWANAGSGSLCQVAMSKLPPALWYRYTSAISISSEPSSVY